MKNFLFKATLSLVLLFSGLANASPDYESDLVREIDKMFADACSIDGQDAADGQIFGGDDDFMVDIGCKSIFKSVWHLIKDQSETIMCDAVAKISPTMQAICETKDFIESGLSLRKYLEARFAILH